MSIWLNPLVWFVEKTLNPLLQSEQKNRHLIEQLKGKRIVFSCIDPELNLVMDITHDGKAHLFSDPEVTNFDLELSGTKQQWITQAISVNESQLLVNMKGDVQIAAKLHELVQSFDIDWGALLEPYVGNQASQISHMLLKGVHKQSARFLKTLTQSSKEYIQHEADVSVSANEAEYFYSQIDNLNAKAERLLARANRILRKKNTH